LLHWILQTIIAYISKGASTCDQIYILMALANRPSNLKRETLSTNASHRTQVWVTRMPPCDTAKPSSQSGRQVALGLVRRVRFLNLATAASACSLTVRLGSFSLLWGDGVCFLYFTCSSVFCCVLLRLLVSSYALPPSHSFVVGKLTGIGFTRLLSRSASIHSPPLCAVALSLQNIHVRS
jgi:hypothetical protein